MIDSAGHCLQAAPAGGGYAPPRIAPETSAQRKSDPRDAVELSDRAQKAAEPADSRPVRRELVDRVRSEIARGEYLTEDKLDAVVNRLQQKLFSE